MKIWHGVNFGGLVNYENLPNQVWWSGKAARAIVLSCLSSVLKRNYNTISSSSIYSGIGS